MTKLADLRRRVRARVTRARASHPSVRRRQIAGPDGVAVARMAAALHVTNGDCTDIAGTGIARRVLVWRDVLHEGPVPAVSYDHLRRIRAAFLADEPEFTLRMFQERDSALEANRGGEYVLWFEADLYDQLQIVEILARLSELAVPPERISLICIGEYPGIAHFGGLGQLEPQQLRELPATAARAELTTGALDLAARAWSALRAPEPYGLGAIAEARSGELRFLGEAFERLSREYPSTRDGLSLTERRVLAATASGEHDAGTVFARTIEREARPFLGDTWCFGAMERLARAPSPLLTAEPDDARVHRRTRLRLTDTGARVLAGREDHVRLNGIDRWIGGVHLLGKAPRWRWGEGTEAITASR